jgi:HEAT repeat protein
MHGGQKLPPAHEQELIEEWIQELRHQEWSAANATEDCLVERGAAAVIPLCHALSFGSTAQRWRAARALGRIGDPRAVQALAASLAVRPEPVRAGRNRATLRERRPNREGLLRIEAATALGRIGSAEGIVPLGYALADPADGVGWSAQQALVLIGAASVPALCQISRSPHVRARQLAAGALGALANEQGISPLVALLSDPEREVRRAAAAALGHFAQLHPARQLRGALAPLRRLLSLRQLTARDLHPQEGYRRTLETAIAEIERRVPDLRSLPLPARPAAPGFTSLPRPAEWPTSPCEAPAMEDECRQ